MSEPTEPRDRIPYVGIIAAVTAAILAGFCWVTWYALTHNATPEMRGSLIQTWNNLAVAVGAFWLGSSVGGKLGSRKP